MTMSTANLRACIALPPAPVMQVCCPHVVDGPRCANVDRCSEKGFDIPGVLTAKLAVDGHILWISTGVQDILGHPPQALVGRDLYVLLTDEDRAAAQAAIGELVDGSDIYDLRLRCRTVREEVVWLTFFARGDAESGTIVLTAFDTTVQHKLAESLSRSEERLLESQNIGRIGSWWFDIVNDVLDWSPEHSRLYGFDPLDPPSNFSGLLTRVHPDDRELLQELMRRILATGQDYDVEFRVLLPDGTMRHMLGRGRCHRDKRSGTITRLSGTSQDVTRHKEYEAELSVARERAEAASRAKSSFLAHISHELRTPMNGILGIADLFDADELGERERGHLKLIQSSASSLLTLLNDLLDLSQIEAGRLDLFDKPTDLRKLTSEICQLFAPTAARKEIGLTRSLAQSTPQAVFVDPSRLRQILTNLIDNALKYTEAGHVSLEVKCEVFDGRARLRFVVTDTGLGIGDSDLALVFGEFERASQAPNGAGLGLAICRRLAEKMGARLCATSEVGEGSQFWLELEAPIVVLNDPSSRRESTAERLGHRSLKLLVAEDNEVNAIVITTMLAKLGHHTTLAANGLRVLETLEKEEFDGIFMDCHMPVMNGLDAVQAIRASPRWSGIPVVAVTASTMSRELDRYRDAGMDDVLSKPISISSLRHSIVGIRRMLDVRAGAGAEGGRGGLVAPSGRCGAR